MANYLFCASNESIPGILCISYRCHGPLKDALRLLNIRGNICSWRSSWKYTRLPTPYNFVFIKKLRECGGRIEFEGMVEELHSYINTKLNIVDNDNNNLVGYGKNFYKNSIEEVKVLFDHIEGNYVDYLIEDAEEDMKSIKKSINNRIMKETEDRIINSYLKTLEDTLEDTLDIMKETEDRINNNRIMKETEDIINNNRIMKETDDIINNEKIMKETEDRIINSYFKTLEDTLEKNKGELERLDAIIIDRNTEIAELNKIIKYIKK
jgi:hypothetical protein